MFHRVQTLLGPLAAIFAIVGAVFAATPAYAVTLQKIRAHEGPEHTRIVFETPRSVSYEVSRLTGPDRIVVDLRRTALARGLDPHKAVRGHKRIKRVRSARHDWGQRVVFDMAGAFSHKVFQLKPVRPYGHRLVVDLFPKNRAKPSAVPKCINDCDVIIAVDAGHGGEDPGALGAHGIHEKTVVLQMARKLAAAINKTPGYRAVLVRTGDYYISLRNRTQIARNRRAHMFVSLHADAFTSPKASGASVYAVSLRGASSERARLLADQENSADLLGGVGDISLRDKDPMLAKVLVDMSSNSSLAASLAAGEMVLKKLGGVTKLHSNKVEQAGFVVLKSPDIPSLLIETGYITNPREARRLSQADHQNRIVKAIHSGLNLYFQNSPPAGTRLAERRRTEGFRYVVGRGDTLSEIAQRHGTSIAQLRRANRLRGDRIRVGQVIVIPAKS